MKYLKGMNRAQLSLFQQSNIMRIIALTSLALALSASSAPVSSRTNDAVPIDITHDVHGVTTNGKVSGNGHDTSFDGSTGNNAYSVGLAGKRLVPPLSSTSDTVQGEASRLIGTAESAAGASNPITSTSSTVTSRTVGQLPGNVGSSQIDTVVDEVEKKLGNPAKRFPSDASASGSIGLNGDKISTPNGLRARALGGVVDAVKEKVASTIAGAAGGKVGRGITDTTHPANIGGNGVTLGGSASGSVGGEVRRNGLGPLPSSDKVDTSDLKGISSTVQSTTPKVLGSRGVKDTAGKVVDSVKAAAGQASGATSVVGNIPRGEIDDIDVKGAVKKLVGAAGSSA